MDAGRTKDDVRKRNRNGDEIRSIGTSWYH
jgi:hypothetical protein